MRGLGSHLGTVEAMNAPASNKPVSAQPPSRRFAHPGRIAVVAVIVIAVANLAVWGLSQSDTSTNGTALPATIESITPQSGQLIRLQDTLSADLRDDLTGVLVIDGAEVPEDQLERVVPLAQVSFRPSPKSDLTKFEPGDHTVVIKYWQQGKPRPTNPNSFSWRFRAGA